MAEKKPNKIKLFIDNILFKLGFKKRKAIPVKESGGRFSNITLDFVDDYEEGNVVKSLDEIIVPEGFVGKSAEKLYETTSHISIFPDKKDYQYVGIKNVNLYFLNILVKSISFTLLYAIVQLIGGTLFESIPNIIGFFLFFLLGGIYYPKIQLLLFKGEIKIQILMAMLHIVSMLNSGSSLQECVKNISSNGDYGIVSFEFKTIIYDIVRGGYGFTEALVRARERTKINLMKRLYAQLITASTQGQGQLLLYNLYNELIRETTSTLDNSKFQIGNLGNLAFGTGLILPFSGMLQGALSGGGGYDGINNTLNFVMGTMGPMLTIVFTLFVKWKIDG